MPISHNPVLNSWLELLGLTPPSRRTQLQQQTLHSKVGTGDGQHGPWVDPYLPTTQPWYSITNTAEGFSPADVWDRDEKWRQAELDSKFYPDYQEFFSGSDPWNQTNDSWNAAEQIE